MNTNTAAVNDCEPTQDRFYLGIIAVLSILIPVAVAVLLFSPSKLALEGGWIKFLPHLNGAVNSTTAIALLLGRYFIKKGNIQYHRASMYVAFILGCIFLVAYVIYHSTSLSTHFGGVGMIRVFYFSLLISHIILAAIVVPFVLLAMYFAITNKINQHKKIVKWTFPIWLYVSISGVIVYLLISPYYN